MTTSEVGRRFLISAEDFVRATESANPPVLVDVRPADEYYAGHLAGARHFDPFPFHHQDTSEAGLRMFAAQMEWIFSALGLDSRRQVVFYENNSGMRAARCVWLLEWLGHPDARMLDGGA